MRNMSFMLTTAQFLDGSKDVTRRMGWLFLKADQIVMGVEKAQGLIKGGKIKRLGLIKIKTVWRERLSTMVDMPDYGKRECRRIPRHEPVRFYHHVLQVA